MTFQDLRRLPDPGERYDQKWANALLRTLRGFFEHRDKGDRFYPGRLTTAGGRSENVVDVAQAAYTIQRQNEVIDVNHNAAVTLTLPLQPFRGQRHTVQDSSGNAAVNNITINPPGGINLNGGSGGLVISSNFGRLIFNYNGEQYIGA